MYQFSGNLNSFLDLISTYSLSKLTNLNKTFVFNVHILEIHNLMTKYGAFTCVKAYTSKLHMYRFSGNLISFFGLISTHTISKLPNLNKTFVLVYKFTF